MKIQISPANKVADAMVVWHEKLPEVDLVMDARSGLTFKEGSIKAIYVFDLLGLSEPRQIFPIINNLYSLLEPDGEIYIIEMDFDYLTRAYVGGDLTVAEFNQDFLRRTYFNQGEIVRILDKAGFPEKDQRIWYDNLQFNKKHYEMIVSGKKPNK